MGKMGKEIRQEKKKERKKLDEVGGCEEYSNFRVAVWEIKMNEWTNEWMNEIINK